MEANNNNNNKVYTTEEMGMTEEDLIKLFEKHGKVAMTKLADAVDKEGKRLMKANNKGRLALPYFKGNRHVYRWPTPIRKNHIYWHEFSLCWECCCTDNCVMYKLGAQGCTVKDKVMRDESI